MTEALGSDVNALTGFTSDAIESSAIPDSQQDAATWGETVRRVARTSIDAAMWITPAAMTTVRFGTEAAFAAAHTTLATTTSAASAGVSFTNTILQTGFLYAPIDPSRRASLESLAAAVHIMSHIVRGAIGVGTSAASMSISVAQAAVLTGVRVADLTTRLSLHGSRYILDQTDIAINAAMQGPLMFLLGHESAEVMAGFGRLLMAEYEPLRQYGVPTLARVCLFLTLARAFVAYGSVQYLCGSRLREPPPVANASPLNLQEQLELQRYMRFASAAYGAFGRLWMTGDSNSMYAGVMGNHNDTVCAHTGIPPHHIIWSQWTGDVFMPIHFLAVDMQTRAIVVVIRGSMSLQDVMSDLYCHSENMAFSSDTVEGEVHAGMMEAARRLNAVLLGRVEQALRDRRGFKLRLVGHSYGAGVAALLAMMWQPLFEKDGVDIHAYTYAVPCVMSPMLSESCKGLVTSVALMDDIVCRLSYASAKDIMTAVAALCEQPDICNKIIIAAGDGNVSEDTLRWLRDVHIILHADNQVNKLCPPGRILHIYEKGEQTNIPRTGPESLSETTEVLDSEPLETSPVDGLPQYSRRRTRSDTYTSTENDPWDADVSKDLLVDNDGEQEEHAVQLEDALTEELGDAENDAFMEDVDEESTSFYNESQSEDERHRSFAHTGTLHMHEVPSTYFNEIVFSKYMLSSHMPRSYEKALCEVVCGSARVRCYWCEHKAEEGE